MKWILMAVFLMLVQFGAHQDMMNLNNQEIAYQRIMDAMQLASQDAVEQVEVNSTVNGKPIFNTGKADSVFRTDLANNLQLNPTTLTPDPNTLLQVAPVIEEEKFIDWSNATFPDVLTDSQSGISMTLTAPSIVFLVKFTIPSVVSGVQPFVLTLPMVQSYNGG